MSDPIGALIVEARQKAKGRNGFYVAKAKDCMCEVEISYFTNKSTREHISRCQMHQYPHNTIISKGTS